MANSIITTAGLALFADAAATGKTIAIDKMIFADVPGLDVSQTPDPAQGLPAGIVCRTEIDRSAKIDDRTVVYSKTLAATVGDFYINWIGLYSTAESTLVAVCCVPRHKKYATSEFEAGNTLYKNFALSFANAAALTGITIAPEAWQMQGEYALKEHTHTIPQVTGLQAALDGKENAGAVAAHNASGVAHWELFRGKISKPETGSAGQYLKLNPDGTCSWSDIDCVPVGTIFPFASAQPPAGAYLLNGQTIANCQTLYPQFWTWLSAEAAAGRVRTVADNAAFESELTAKGNCGAFVLNAGGTAGAVRLPSVTAGFADRNNRGGGTAEYHRSVRRRKADRLCNRMGNRRFYCGDFQRHLGRRRKFRQKHPIRLQRGKLEFHLRSQQHGSASGGPVRILHQGLQRNVGAFGAGRGAARQSYAAQGGYRPEQPHGRRRSEDQGSVHSADVNRSEHRGRLQRLCAVPVRNDHAVGRKPDPEQGNDF